ncbi:alpha-tocopherol transfer protein-like isoform X2 [Cydia strobilella]|uniref:alpha-tocopherol transfer protein-like isoform X2 n=1 Tax=Cydia strobilella TaxID=1100964 RepID=UPI003007743C
MSAPVVVKQFPLEKEYAKKTGVTPEDVAKLRAWLATQPHLPGELLTDLDLVLAYHCCQQSAEVSKQVLDLHFTLKTLFTNFFKDRLVTEKTFATLSMVCTVPLKVSAHNDSAVFYCRLTDADAKKFVFHECVRVALMTLDLWQEEEGTWPGLEIIFDMRLFSLQHLPKVDLHTLQQFLYYLQEAMLMRVTGLHFINAPSFIDKLMMLIKPFLKKELLECLFIHQIGATTLEKHLPMDGLPEEAGGKGISLSKATEDLKERFQLNKDFFERENKRRVVESRRPGRPKTISDIFGGIEGSFKKLDID